MIRFSLMTILWLWLSVTGALAQVPRVTMELGAEETVVGQPLILRMKILVPTWLSKPPVFPDLEVPSLLVRLPERATGPISERIDGDTWSGVQRGYRLYPLAERVFRIEGKKIAITYAEAGKPEPIIYETSLPDIVFTAALPPAARDLSPPIIAKAFLLEQTVEGESSLAVGEAVTRTVSARISGTTPVLIPRLSPIEDATGLRGYAQEPVVSESENRGVLSGTRSETTSYVAQSGGQAVLAEISLDWYNLETGKVETATLPAINLEIAGAAPSPASPMDPADIAWLVARVLLIAGLVWVLIYYAGPPVSAWAARAQTRWRQSERYAARRVLNTIRRRDLAAATAALSAWAAFYPCTRQTGTEPVRSALARIGRARFGAGGGAETAQDWTLLERAFAEARGRARAAVKRDAAHQALPPLNS